MVGNWHTPMPASTAKRGFVVAVALRKLEGGVAVIDRQRDWTHGSIVAVAIAVATLGMVVDRLLEIAACIDQARVKSARTMVS